MRRAYPSELSNRESASLLAHLPPPGRGRAWQHPVRELLDGSCYVVRTGCQWRARPHEYPPWQTVYWWCRRVRRDGTWEELKAALRQHVRVLAGRQPQPSACSIDSQRVKTAGVGASVCQIPRGRRASGSRTSRSVASVASAAFCPAGGEWSEPSPGSFTAGAWSVTMSA
jgi:transposase